MTVQNREETVEEKSLRWHYCEDGCKGYSLTVGRLYFWMYAEIRNGQLAEHVVFTTHNGIGGHIGTYSSRDEADREIRMLVAPEFERLKAEIVATGF